jgi:hypothetical protein
VPEPIIQEPTTEPNRRLPTRRVVTLLTAFGAVVIGLCRLSSPGTAGGETTLEVEPKPLAVAAPAASTGSDEIGQAAGLTKGTPPRSRIAAGLVGAQTCRECHPGESAASSRSGHSRTLRRGDLGAIARWLDGRTVKDPEVPAATWTYALANGKLEVERAENGKYQCFPLDFAVGSGANGVTFITTRHVPGSGPGVTGVEHRLSYITRRGGLLVTPGQGKDDSMSKRDEVSPSGRVLDGAALEKCLNCHATATATHGADQFDPDTLVPNVSCERCHGPGRDHVRAARKGLEDEALKVPLGLDDSAPLRQIFLCGQCHRTINSVSPRQVDERNPEIASFQPVGLELSRCFQQGKSGLRCTSCHDPHARVSRDHTAYEAVCLKCHSPLHRRTCPVSATEGCIKCHMPTRTVSVEFEFTDHWIHKPDPEKGKVPTR